MGYDGLTLDIWLTPQFQVRTGLLGAGRPPDDISSAPCSMPNCSRASSRPAPAQAFIDVAYAGKGPGATELRQPFVDAFEAGFFEDKPSFDKALQVGGWG